MYLTIASLVFNILLILSGIIIFRKIKIDNKKKTEQCIQNSERLMERSVIALSNAIEAKDSVEALLQAKKFPGVKHGRSRYICTAREITREEYIEQRKVSAYEKALR